MRVRVGTSGFSYKEWKGSFYPEDLRASEMLAYYASRFDAVEINNTFYRMPSENLLRGWAEQVPEGFSFVLKASRRITHERRLKDAESPLAYLLRISSILDDKRGPMLFQLPPYLSKDVPRLRDFLALLPDACRAAVEFRHDSWLDEEVYDALRERNVALVVADVDADRHTPILPTADFGYLRLRGEDYGEAELGSWAERVLDRPWGEAHVFFKHEEAGAGPRLAARFRRLAGGAP